MKKRAAHPIMSVELKTVIEKKKALIQGSLLKPEPGKTLLEITRKPKKHCLQNNGRTAHPFRKP